MRAAHPIEASAGLYGDAIGSAHPERGAYLVVWVLLHVISKSADMAATPSPLAPRGSWYAIRNKADTDTHDARI